MQKTKNRPRSKRIEISPHPAHMLANRELLKGRELAFVCSRKCPGDMISDVEAHKHQNGKGIDGQSFPAGNFYLRAAVLSRQMPCELAG